MATIVTGPEHYREATALLESAENVDNDRDWSDHDARALAVANLAARAQAHATLALAAAVLARFTDNPADWKTALEGTA